MCGYHVGDEDDSNAGNDVSTGISGGYVDELAGGSACLVSWACYRRQWQPTAMIRRSMVGQ